MLLFIAPTLYVEAKAPYYHNGSCTIWKSIKGNCYYLNNNNKKVCVSSNLCK